MASEIKVDTIVNAGGDNDTGIDLATNDQILLKVANATRLTMNATGQTTIVGEGGTTTTSVQQGLCKVFSYTVYSGGTPTSADSFNVTSYDDNGTGNNDINFTNNMGGSSYVLSGMGNYNTRVVAFRPTSGNTLDSGFINIYNYDIGVGALSQADNGHCVSVDGDLA